jgi:hypothetical protein
MTLAALVLAAAMVLPRQQAQATAPAAAVRLHHLHFRTDDFAASLTEAARAYGGTRTILQGLGPGVRVGDAYLLFERPAADQAERAGERRDLLASRVNGAADWLRARGVAATISNDGRRIMAGGAVDAPLDHVAFAADDLAVVERALRHGGIEPARRTAVSLFYRSGDEAVEITADTDRPDAFWCPMHPDVRTPAANKCPICAMDLVPIAPPRAGEYRLDVTGRTAADGRSFSGLSLRIRDPDTGRDVAMFAEAHERLLHLFVIGRDLQYFAHEHPERTAGGFELATRLPPGAYMLIADFVPGGGYPQMVHRAIVTPGYRASPFGDAPRLEQDLSDKVSAGMRVALRVDPARGRPEAVLRFRFADASDGAPIDDLQPYLGAAGHLLVVSPDLTHSVHAHPEGAGAGPGIDFHVQFPEAGVYKLWVQVQRKGTVVSVPFVVRIPGA